MTSVAISPDLNCSVSHAGDAQPEFYGTTACGTFLATGGGTVYGPANVPAGIGGHPAYTPVSQTSTGSGSSVDPYVVTTVVALADSGLRITQKDSFVVGQESYRTDTTVSNTGTAVVNAVLYKAADCYLQNSDTGFGSYDAITGAVSCVAADIDDTGNAVRGTRIEQFYPLSAGSNYYESGYYSVWRAVDTGAPLPNTCEGCADNIDNGAALSWSLTIAAGASITKSHLTTFSPLGIQPMTTAKTADDGSVAAGAADGYTITVHNPNATPQQLSSITDSLPSGFSYTPGSSSGATTANPAVSSQQLTWSGSFSVPAEGDLRLHFTVSASTTPGTYYNNAGGTSQGLVVVPTGDTAPVVVTAVNHAPVATGQSVSTPQDTAKAVRLSGSDPDGDDLSFVVVSQPGHGSLSGTAPNLTYTPAAGYSGADSFSFTVSDGSLTSAPSTVSITVTPVATGCLTSTPTVDATTSSDQRSASRTTKVKHVTTGHADELLVAFVKADGPISGGAQRVLSVSGGGLDWSLVKRANGTGGTVEVWQAHAGQRLVDVTITAKLRMAYDSSISITSFSGATERVGASSAASARTGAPAVTLTPGACGSLVWGAGHDWSHAATPIAASGQSLVHLFRDTRVHDSFWVMKVDEAVSTLAPVTVRVSGISRDRWQLVGVEIPGRPAAS